jgi:deoxyadenosine/deoxycytidine kinase
MERMKKRGRNEESTVGLDYLTELHDYHESWLTKLTTTPVLIIENDNDDNWYQVIDQVNNFVEYSSQLTKTNNQQVDNLDV